MWFDRSPFSRSQKLWIALAAVLGFLLRVNWLTEQNAVQPMYNSDEYLYYVSTAENALNGRGFFPSYNEMADGIYVPPPMQSWFLMAVFSLLGDNNWSWAKAVQALIASLVILLCAGIGRRAHSRLAGLFLAYLFALYPPFIFFNSYLLTESNFLSALVVLLWLTLKWLERPRIGWACGAAVWLGLMHLQRVNLLMFGAVLALFSLWRTGVRKRLISALCFLVIPLVVLTPWLIRNVVVYGEPVLVSSNGGFNFYFSNHPELDPVETPYFKDIVEKKEVWRPEIESKFRKDGRLTVTYHRYSQEYMGAALKYIAGHPFHFIRNYMIKLCNQFSLFQPIGYKSIGVFRNESVALVLHWLVLACGLLGFVVCVRGWRDEPMLMMLLSFGYLTLIGGFFVQAYDGRWNLYLKLFLLFFISAAASSLFRGALVPKYTSTGLSR